MKNEHPEAEINRIRLELYEETKDLALAERTLRSNEQGQRLAEQYGFTIGTPKDNISNTSKVI